MKECEFSSLTLPDLIKDVVVHFFRLKCECISDFAISLVSAMVLSQCQRLP